MAEREVSQSELARRIGISQASIFRLVAGKAYGSTHLHKIARELGTTPAYLTGETDDPNADAPDTPELTSEERELVECFRHLDRMRQVSLLSVARGFMAPPPGVSINAPGRTYDAGPAPIAQDLGNPPPLPPQHALEAMFTGMLSRAQELHEADRPAALASYLPKALAQAADVDPDPVVAQTPPNEKAAHPARRARRR